MGGWNGWVGGERLGRWDGGGGGAAASGAPAPAPAPRTHKYHSLKISIAPGAEGRRGRREAQEKWLRAERSKLVATDATHRLKFKLQTRERFINAPECGKSASAVAWPR
jgi:hypothetical protein